MKKSTRLIQYTVLFCICLMGAAILFMGGKSLAWISANRETQAQTIELQPDNREIDVSAEIYKYNVKEFLSTSAQTTTPDTVTKTTSGVNTSMSLDLNQYDPIFTINNPYTPLLVKLTLTSSTLKKAAGSVTLTIERSNEGDQPSPSATTKTITGDTHSSTVLKFSAITSTTLDGITDDDMKMYKSAFIDSRADTSSGTATFEFQGKTFKSFTTLGTNGTITKTDKVTFSGISYTASEVTPGADGRNSVNVYLAIEYDPDLIQAYRDNNNLSTEDLKGNSLNLVTDFINDITSIMLTEE